jgi:putative endonuclease
LRASRLSGRVRGSSPLTSTTSVLRTSRLEREAEGFESPYIHHFGPISSMTETRAYYVYVLWSESRAKFYVGSCADIDDRLVRHNAGRSKYTRTGTPWLLVHSEQFASRSEAVRRESEIKSWKSAARIRQMLGEHPV